MLRSCHGLCLPTLVVIAQAVFLLQHRQTRLNALPHAAVIKPAWGITFNMIKLIMRPTLRRRMVTSFPIDEQSIALSVIVCLSVCLSVCSLAYFNKSPLLLTDPRDAVPEAQHVHRCRRSVWWTGNRDRHHFTTVTVHLNWQHLRRSVSRSRDVGCAR